MLKPFVQDFVKIDVRQKGRDHASLWRAGVWVRKLTCFENPSLEPLINYPSYHTIAHPQVKKAPEMSMLGLSFEVRQLPGYFIPRNRLGFGWMVSSCAPTTTTMVPKATPNRNENILFSWLSG